MADNDFYVRLRGRYAELISGSLSVEDLDDEELSQGRLKDKNGQFRGQRPKMVPQELVTAMRREWLSRAEAKLREALYDGGLATYVALARDNTIDPGVRLRAADRIVERTMGKVPDRVQIAAEDPVEALFRNILGDPLGLVPHELSAEERALLQ